MPRPAWKLTACLAHTRAWAWGRRMDMPANPDAPRTCRRGGGLAACPPSLTLGCPAQARGDSAGHAVLPCPPAKGRAAERLPPAYALAGTLHTAPTFLRAAAGLQAAPPPPAQARKPKGLATVTCPLLSPLYATCKGWTAERLPPAYAMPCLPPANALAGTLHTAPTFLRAAAGLQAAPPPPAQARKPKGLATVTCPLLSPLHATCKGWTAERLPPAYAMPCLPRKRPCWIQRPLSYGRLQACRRRLPHRRRRASPRAWPP